MANTNHKDLTGVSLHEPKGVAAATVGQVYIADGAASGTWTAAVNPTGSILLWSVTAVPSGYLECDGSSVSKTTYAALFTVIGYTYGGSGANMDLPDYRGYFLRGWDHGRGKDPDASSRTNRGDGTTGDNVGTTQGDSLKSHTHTVTGSQTDSSEQGQSGNHSGTKNQAGQVSSAPSTGSANESRGKNINIMFCIKT